MKNVLIPGVGTCPITLNGFGRVPTMVEGWLVVGVNVCVERIIDGGVVGEVLSHYMARLQIRVLNWGLIGRVASPWGVALVLDVWIAGAGVGVWVHIRYSQVSTLECQERLGQFSFPGVSSPIFR